MILIIQCILAIILLAAIIVEDKTEIEWLFTACRIIIPIVFNAILVIAIVFGGIEIINYLTR